jgi:hypothetical protein
MEMGSIEVSELQVIGGVLMLAALFVLREFASGALKKAGEEFWLWLRRGRAGGTAAATQIENGAGPGHQTEGGGRDGGRAERDADADRSPCLRPLVRGDVDDAAVRRPPMSRTAPPESQRKSA